MKKEAPQNPADYGAAPAEGTEAGKSAPAANVSMDYSGEFTVGNLHLRSTATGVVVRNDAVGKTGIVAPKAKDQGGLPAATNGFGAAGELRIGKITLSVSNDATDIRLRRENVGHYTETDAEIFVDLLNEVFFGDDKHGQPIEHEFAEAAIEGVLDGAFFDRRVQKNGNVTTNIDRVRQQGG